jgi:hypothetical protein
MGQPNAKSPPVSLTHLLPIQAHKVEIKRPPALLVKQHRKVNLSALHDHSEDLGSLRIIESDLVVDELHDTVVPIQPL